MSFAPGPYPPIPDQGLPPDEVIDALIAGIVRITRRVEIYENDAITPFDIPLWDGRLVDGEVTVDRERDERRMCDVTLTNYDNALRINPIDGFWYDKILKVFWGIRYFSAGVEKRWETQIGEFLIDSISEASFPHTVKIVGRDYAKKCLQTKLKSSLSFSQYTPVEDIIAALAGNSGITKLSLPYTGQGFAQDIVFERGTERWKVMRQLAESIGYELYFRGDGNLTMRPYGDPTLSPLRWIFNQSPLDGTLVNYERTSNDSRIKNHIIVTGATTTDLNGFTQTAFGEAINNDTISPTRVSRIGDRVDPIESDYITDSVQAQALAEQRLRVSALEEFDINFESVIIPWLDGGDIVDIVDRGEGEYVPSRFLLVNFTFPLALNPMTGTARRVTIVGTTHALEYQ
jgi:hypothetical protein